MTFVRQTLVVMTVWFLYSAANGVVPLWTAEFWLVLLGTFVLSLATEFYLIAFKKGQTNAK